MVERPDVSAAALRRLAQGLLYDRHGAEDVVQEAWLAFLRSEPSASRAGGWLTETVRRLARNRRRDESRRHARERRAARAEATPGMDERAAQLEILHRLLDALGRLDEPYRSAVMLRYLEDLPPREIARRLALPVNTARTHVRRGLERLRRDLDGEHGQGRQRLLAVLAPLAGESRRVLAGPGQAVPPKLALLSSAAVFVLGVSWLLLRATEVPEPGEPRLSSPQVVKGETTGEPAEEPRLAERENKREPLGGNAALDASWVVRGHAFRGRSEPFPGLPLVGRVFAGTRADGTPLLEEHFVADEAGDFAWAIDPPSDLVTVSVDPVIGEHLEYPASGVFVPGDPAPERWLLWACPLDSFIRGTVRDEAGLPIANARVETDQEQQANCDALGDFELRAASDWFDPEVGLIAMAPGHVERQVSVTIRPSATIQVPDLVLKQGSNLRGRILDEKGAPIDGARVSATFWADRAVTSDESGAFDLGGIDFEEPYLLLHVTKHGFVEAMQEIAPESRAATIEVRLQRSVRVTGRLFDPAGSPLWGAWITVGQGRLDGEFDALPRMGFTDREGRFVLENIAPGRQRFWPHETGYAQESLEVNIPGGTAAFEIELRLKEPSHFVAGIVLDAGGAPLPWAQISLIEESSTSFWSGSAGRDGRFRIESLPSRPMTLGVRAENHAKLEQELAGLDRDDLVLQLMPLAGFAGRVVDGETGSPLSSFVVHVGGPPHREGDEVIRHYPWNDGRSFTSPDGSWSLRSELLQADQVASIGVDAPGYAPSTLDFVRVMSAPEPDDLVVRLVRSTSVQGRVLETTSGAPIAGARVRRLSSRASLLWLQLPEWPFSDWPHYEPHRETTTDPTGHFEFLNVPAAEMSLAVDHPDWVLTLDGPFLVGAQPCERRIELGRGASIRGSVRDTDGRYLSGQTVSLRCYDGFQEGRKWETITDAEGSFLFTTLAPGPFEVDSLRALGTVTLRESLTVQSEETLETVLQLGGRATLIGTLQFEGELPEFVAVQVASESAEPADTLRERWARSRWVTWAQDGRFEIGPLEAGEYVVSVEFRVGEFGDFGESEAVVFGEARVLVPADGSAEVRVPLQRHDF